MNLVLFDNIESNDEKWNKVIEESEESTVFHTLNWKNTIEKTYKLKSNYYFINKGEKITGIIPVFQFRTLKQKKIFVSLPYSQEGGIISNNIDNTGIYNEISKLNTIFIKEKAKNIEGKSTLTMVLKLPKDGEKLLFMYNARTRQYCNKSISYNLSFLTNDVGIDLFYRIYSQNMKRLGTPHHKKSFYQNILKNFNNDAKIWGLKCNNEIISAIFLLFFRKTVYNLHALSLPGYENIRPNILINWYAMKTSLEMGYEKFDFGRSTLNKGTYEFKKRFGAEEVFFDYYFLNNGKRAETGVPQPGIASEIWKKSPDFITNILGPKIRKYVP